MGTFEPDRRLAVVALILAVAIAGVLGVLPLPDAWPARASSGTESTAQVLAALIRAL